LEHQNSLTLGAPAEELAHNPVDLLSELTHEYFHAWNLVALKPAGFWSITYKDPPVTRELWWSEGITMYYSDLIMRRAGFKLNDSNRIRHLEGLLKEYFGNPGNTILSPEFVSTVANGEPGKSGDYNSSPHLQGEVIGNMLDLLIRAKTNNKRNIDQVMQKMYLEYAHKGFTGKDIEQEVAKICHCAIDNFFKQHIQNNKPLDPDRYLKYIGLRTAIEWKEVVDDQQKPVPELRIFAWENPEKKLLLGISDPNGCWGRAGLHTNDRIISINGSQVADQRSFFRMMRNAHIGDRVEFEIEHNGTVSKRTVTVGGYKMPEVRIIDAEHISRKQLTLRDSWLNQLGIN
jgi:predicted metalloprotease with PDZ domain